MDWKFRFKILRVIFFHFFFFFFFFFLRKHLLFLVVAVDVKGCCEVSRELKLFEHLKEVSEMSTNVMLKYLSPQFKHDNEWLSWSARILRVCIFMP